MVGVSTNGLNILYSQDELELICLYIQEKQLASWIECQWSCWQHVHLGAKIKPLYPRLHLDVIQNPEILLTCRKTIFIWRSRCKKIDTMSRKSTNSGVKYLHLRCVSTLHCKQGRKKLQWKKACQPQMIYGLIQSALNSTARVLLCFQQSLAQTGAL